ncbi:zeta toxin family protein [uncultured Friedmanniella sp.]|uniref:zeta toxin family protein n=1 Tax=uncultured Friedmanniella sp. TaxID=335381 RepID=UPI0035CC916A
MFDAVFLNGTVGAGKTTTAAALSGLLNERRQPHAVVDLDQIRLLFPAATDDPFQHEVELANLRDLAANYRSAGAVNLIVAGVLESPPEIPRYVAALGVPALLICRLLVDPDTAGERLNRRHVDDPAGLRWHLQRTTSLTAVLDRARLDDVEVETTGRTPLEVAREVQRHAGWALDVEPR